MGQDGELEQLEEATREVSVSPIKRQGSMSPVSYRILNYLFHLGSFVRSWCSGVPLLSEF